MKHLIIKLIFPLALMLFLTGNVLSQNINVAAFGGNYDPSVFPGYPSTGNFSGYFTKTSGTIPANGARAIISLAPEIPWSQEVFTVPTGWTLDLVNSTPTNLVFDLTAPWTNASDDPIFIIPVKSNAPRSETAFNVGLQIFAKPGPNWQGSTSQTDNSQYTAVQVADVPLPVTLIYFGLSKEGATANLKWTTTEEINSDHFEVQHSISGKSWTNIGEVTSNGESKIQHNYSFTHVDPVRGENLYRLKMIDKDLTYTYSRIQSLSFDEGSPVSMYPNPVSDILFLDKSLLKSVKSLAIISASGTEVLSKSSFSANGISVKGLPDGTYVVKIVTTTGAQHTHKVVIAK